MRQRKSIVAIVVASLVSSCTHTPPNSYQVKDLPVERHLSESEKMQLRSPSSHLDDTPWTTWSEKNTKIGALLALSEVRENLLKSSIHDPHVNYNGYTPLGKCPDTLKYHRSADGTCYDFDKPYVGAANVAFGRNVSEKFIDQDADKKLMTPNPALVSKEFFTRDEFKPIPFLNMLAAVWIQFMNHDWLTHGRNKEENPHRIQGDKSEIIVEQTKDNYANSNQYKRNFGKISLNEVTHWWDGSQIYGSNQNEQNQTRSFVQGQMRTEQFVNGKELLPKNPNLNVAHNKQNQGYEVTGFRDNWWVGLSMLHTLFVKEHNAIAKMLLKNHARFDHAKQLWRWSNEGVTVYLTEQQLDEKLFQTARLINAAVMAKIHTVEWTPAVLPNPTLRTAMYINWYGGINPVTWFNKFGLSVTDWFEGTKTGYLIGGIVGDKKDDYGVPYSITEEFTSVYRLHSLLPENLEIRKMANKNKITRIPFLETRNEKSYPLMEKYDLKDLYYSFGTQHPGQLVLNNFPKFMQDLPIPGFGKMDLGMVDVLRDRERSVPRYNQFRRGINLKPISSYRDFFPADKPLDARQQGLIEKFNKVYGKDANGNDNVEMIDVLVGTLAEEVRPDNFGFGETLFQIFILMASRRLMADPFYTDKYNAQYYTRAGLNWIDDEGTLAKVIVRHMPELAPKVRGLVSAFNPWKE